MKEVRKLASFLKVAFGLVAGLYFSAGAESAKPDILLMVVDDPEFANLLNNFREKLGNWMKTHNDPLLPVYETKLNGLPGREAIPLPGE